MKTTKHLLILLLLSVFLFFGTGCMVIHPQQHRSRGVIIESRPNGKIPPGQMKKMTGEKSAKKYAPGQVKKHKNDN